MAATVITPDLEKDIIEQSAEPRASQRSIAAWLLANRGVTIAHQIVGRILRETHAARADATRAHIREHVAPHVIGDLDRLEEIRREAARRMRVQEDDEIWCKLSKVETEILNQKLKASGLDERDDTHDIAAAGARVAARIALELTEEAEDLGEPQS